jgi:hypothetical protein
MEKKPRALSVAIAALFTFATSAAFAADTYGDAASGTALQLAQAAPPPAAVAPAPPPAAAPAPPAAAPASPTLLLPLTALSPNPDPFNVELGPLGKVYATGAASGLLLWQDARFPSDKHFEADISNGQVFLQNTAGLFQFFLQAGVYSIPALGSPYIRASTANSTFFGPLPQAFAKLAPSDSFSVMAGKLPTLIGDETTFTFQNFNIERGLLWNQEPAVNRGVQVNYTVGPVALSGSWNDGFYSDRFNWATGSVTYTIDSNNSLAFTGGGNLGRTGKSTIATPLLQNNSEIYDWIYNGTWGPFSVSPYVQYTNVSKDLALGIAHGASTIGFALMGAYTVNDNMKVAARGEYITSTGSLANGAPSLLYGPGSDAWSITLTPTYQYKIFFARGEFSYVEANHITPGFAFGVAGTKSNQVRLLFETGVLF